MAIEDNISCCVFVTAIYCILGCRWILKLIGIFAITILNLIVFVCLATLLVWMMLRSNVVKFQVYDAELTRFDLRDGNNNFHYNLCLNFSVRNSNSHIGVHYDKFEAMVYYGGRRLASVSVPSFYQGHKRTKDLETAFQGQNLFLLGESSRRKFEDETKLGVYGIDVKVRIKVRALFAHLITWPMKPIVRCHLKVPLGSSNSSGGFDFQSTRCHVDI